MDGKESKGDAELLLNRGCGNKAYSVHVPTITVWGDGFPDALDSVVEYIQDHAEELFVEIARPHANVPKKPKLVKCEQCGKLITPSEYDAFGCVCADCATDNMHD